jgi:hypothetical protein
MKVVISIDLPKFALAIGTTLLLAACASSEPAIPETAEAAVAALEASTAPVATNENEDENLVCRSEVRTGTNFKRRVCRTAEEWNARAAAQRGVVEDRAQNERGQAGVDTANGGGGTNAVAP